MKIVAIGGGNYSLDDESNLYNLKEIDEEIIKLSNKQHPRLLYIGFNIKADYYFSKIKKVYQSLGCQCEYLRFNEFSNVKTLESKFKRADILFLPGGNTLAYMKSITRFKLSKYIINFAKQNKVVVGISAGAIMYFDFGCSDSKASNEVPRRYSKVKGLGIQKGLIAPHYMNSDRVYDLPRMLKTCSKKTIAFGIDECVALVIDNENYKVVKSNKNAKVFKCYYANKEYKSIEIRDDGKLIDLYKI